jgi:predicted Zn-dependent protease
VLPRSSLSTTSQAPSHPWRFCMLEAAAVIACFALLGTFLGIRRGGR